MGIGGGTGPLVPVSEEEAPRKSVILTPIYLDRSKKGEYDAVRLEGNFVDYDIYKIVLNTTNDVQAYHTRPEQKDRKPSIVFRVSDKKNAMDLINKLKPKLEKINCTLGDLI